MIKHSNKYNYKVISYSSESFNWLAYATSDNIDHVFLPYKKFSLIKKIKIIFNLAISNNTINVQDKEIISKIKKHRIKLLIIPYPSLFGFRNKIPYIIAMLDIMHKYMLE